MSLSGIFYRDATGSSPSKASSSAPSSGSGASGSPSQDPTAPLVPLQSSVAPTPTATSATGNGGLLGGLLGGLTGLLTSTGSSGGLLGARASRKHTSFTTNKPHQHRTVRTFPIPQRPGRRNHGPIELIAPASFAVREEDRAEWAKRRELRWSLAERQQSPISPNETPLLSNENVVIEAATPAPQVPLAASNSSSSLTLYSAIEAYASAATAAAPEPAFGFTGIFFSTFFGGHDPTWASPTDQHVWFKDFGIQINA